MKQIVSHKESVESTVIDAIYLICNKCGKKLQLEPVADDSRETLNAQEMLEVSFTGGYGNRVIGDMRSCIFHLCQDCTKELIKSFVIETEIKRW